jgi:hypothetical protein
VWQKHTVLAARANSSEPNQRLPEEESVVAAPLILDGKPVAVFGFSSPHEDELNQPLYKTLTQQFAITLASLFHAYRPAGPRRQRKTDLKILRRDRAKSVRSEIANYFTHQRD